MNEPVRVEMVTVPPVKLKDTLVAPSTSRRPAVVNDTLPRVRAVVPVVPDAKREPPSEISIVAPPVDVVEPRVTGAAKLAIEFNDRFAANVAVSPGSELEKLIVALVPPPDANVFAPPRYTLVTLMPAPVPQADTPPVVNTAVVLPAEKPLEVRLVPTQATTGANAKFRPVGRLNVMVAPPTAVCETLNATDTPPLVALMVAEFSAFEKVRVLRALSVNAEAGTAESITVLAAIAA